MRIIRILRFLLLLALPFTAAPLWCDDGTWSNSFHVESGGIYSETDHPDISLEKELLAFDGEKTEVFFLFTNTSKRPVTVTCGFPVVIRLHSFRERDLVKIDVGKYGGRSEGILGLEYFETVERERKQSIEPEFTYRLAIPVNEFNNSREFLPESTRPAEINFSITQDGDPVNIEQVLLERYAGDEGASLTFHYKHDLFFGPGESSVVQVTYAYDMFHGVAGGMGDRLYRWDYMIGTGSTWKGPIGEFYFIHTGAWKWSAPQDFTTLMENDQLGFYYKKNYEPEAGKTFRLAGHSGSVYRYDQVYREFVGKNFKNPVRVRKPEVSAQSFVRNIRSSSHIDQVIRVFTHEGVMHGADFTARSLFDGIPETAWCEGAGGPGLGEYVSFELTAEVWGLSIRNGFNRMIFPDFFYESDKWKEDFRDPDRRLLDYHTLNNRPKTISIVEESGGYQGNETLYILRLEDSREPQVFPGVHLEPGKYRFVIRNVYRGTKWNDTCIGEAEFLAEPGTGQFEALEFTRMTEDALIMGWLEELSF